MPHKPEDQDCSATKPPSAVARALRLLTHKARSVAELEQKLAEEGFDGEARAAALTTVRAWGYLHDGRLAEATQAAAERRGRGRRWLQQRLGARKLPAAEREAALSLHAAHEPQILQELVERRYGAGRRLDGPKDRARALRFLLGRGFAVGAAAAALRAVEQKEGQAGPTTTMDDDAWSFAADAED